MPWRLFRILLGGSTCASRERSSMARCRTVRTVHPFPTSRPSRTCSNRSPLPGLPALARAARAVPPRTRTANSPRSHQDSLHGQSFCRPGRQQAKIPRRRGCRTRHSSLTQGRAMSEASTSSVTCGTRRGKLPTLRAAPLVLRLRREYLTEGEEEHQVFDTKLGRVGMLICTQHAEAHRSTSLRAQAGTCHILPRRRTSPTKAPT